MELLTAAQMREIEAAAIASGAVTGLELMERAGRGVVEAIWEEWPELRAISGRAVVLCGPGNNGGDGFVVARLLKEWGWQVEVFLYGEPEKLPPYARVNYERWVGMGEVRVLTDSSFDTLEFDQPENSICIDALFGTGLTRPFLELGRVQNALNYWQAASKSGDAPRVICLDVPSGMCADSGRYIGYGEENPFDQCVLGNLTVTFHSAKRGAFMAYGPIAVGKLRLVDIGLKRVENCEPARETKVLFERQPLLRNMLSKGQGSHKYFHGCSLLLSGTVAKGGAARLAARGALRIGAGLVTVGCPPSGLMENAQVLDAVMLRRVEDGPALVAMLEEDARINALCLGPGMGTGAREAGLVAAAMDGMKSHPNGALCLDADALTLLAGDADLFAKLHNHCVLTPHAGEFARLFPDIAEKLAAPATKGPAYSKVDATREAAARAGCVVLFKGPDTVIADPDGRCSINSAAYDRAAPWLATAGSGDVLAGFITGLMARGVAPMKAAETGAWLHVECARSFGPGLIAEDLPEELPKVFRALGV